jgi:hypothetical protein
MAVDVERLAEKLSDPDLGETLLPDGSGVLLDIDGHRVLSLSRTAVFLVHQIRDGVTSAEALGERLCERFNIDPATAQKDTADFLADLAGALCGDKGNNRRTP